MDQDQTISTLLGDELEGERTLTWLIHDVHWFLSRDLEREAQRIGLSKAKWRVLAHLSRADAISQTTLAADMGVEKAPLGRILDKLEEDGLIERRPDPDDRRARLVYATQKISPLADQMIAIATNVFAVAFDGIEQAELDQFAKTLARLRQNLAPPRT
jgi:DNA-binding MarR family transcriptional regulator